MAEKSNITPEATDAACLLVGKFMWNWAVLENTINVAYRKLLQIKGLNGYIATANITLRDKVSAVRTVVHHICGHDEEWWKAADKDLLAVSTMNSTHRNLVAHNLFVGHKSGGADFLIVKAKGKFAVPDVVWTPDMFEASFVEIDALRERVIAIIDHVRALQDAPDQIVRAINIFALQPKPEPTTLDAQLILDRPPLASPDVPSPNPRLAAQTPKAPRKKSTGQKSQ